MKLFDGRSYVTYIIVNCPKVFSIVKKLRMTSPIRNKQKEENVGIQQDGTSYANQQQLRPALQDNPENKVSPYSVGPSSTQVPPPPSSIAHPTSHPYQPFNPYYYYSLTEQQGKQYIAPFLYAEVCRYGTPPEQAKPLTDMLLCLSIDELIRLLYHPPSLSARLSEARARLPNPQPAPPPSTIASSTTPQINITPEDIALATLLLSLPEDQRNKILDNPPSTNPQPGVGIQGGGTTNQGDHSPPSPSHPLPPLLPTPPFTYSSHVSSDPSPHPPLLPTPQQQPQQTTSSSPDPPHSSSLPPQPSQEPPKPLGLCVCKQNYTSLTDSSLKVTRGEVVDAGLEDSHGVLCKTNENKSCYISKLYLYVLPSPPFSATAKYNYNPDPQNGQLISLTKGDTVTVKEVHIGWSYIRNSDGTYGYAPTSYLDFSTIIPLS